MVLESGDSPSAERSESTGAMDLSAAFHRAIANSQVAAVEARLQELLYTSASEKLPRLSVNVHLTGEQNASSERIFLATCEELRRTTRASPRSERLCKSFRDNLLNVNVHVAEDNLPESAPQPDHPENASRESSAAGGAASETSDRDSADTSAIVAADPGPVRTEQDESGDVTVASEYKKAGVRKRLFEADSSALDFKPLEDEINDISNISSSDDDDDDDDGNYTERYKDAIKICLRRETSSASDVTSSSLDTGISMFEHDPRALQRNMQACTTSSSSSAGGGKAASTGKLVNFHLVLLVSDHHAIVSVENELVSLVVQDVRVNGVDRSLSRQRQRQLHSLSLLSQVRTFSESSRSLTGFTTTTPTTSSLLAVSPSLAERPLPMLCSTPVILAVTVAAVAYAGLDMDDDGIIEDLVPCHSACRAKRTGLCPGATFHDCASSRVYTVGGLARDNLLANIDYYSTADGAWHEGRHSLPLGWALGAATPLADGSLCLLGGTYSRHHDPRACGRGLLRFPALIAGRQADWKYLSPMREGRVEFSAVALDNEQTLLALGGRRSNTVEAYSFARNSWSSVASMAVGRSCCSATVLGDKTYVVGGNHHWLESPLATVELYDANRDKWLMQKSRLNRARHSAAICTLDNVIYVSGGIGDSVGSSVERMDPREGTWTKLPSMTRPRSRHGMVAVPNMAALFVVGGYDGRAFLNTMEWYEPRIGKWTSALVQPSPM